MSRRHAKVSLKPGQSRAALTITHPNAAGIDIGSAAHFVAVPPDRDDTPVREFPSFTVDLHAVADWLEACRVDTVAMESTGVYWIPMFELLESRGFTVLLVNARHVKNVSGRKSDVLDGFDLVRERRDEMCAITLNRGEAEVFAHAALSLKYDGPATPAPITESQLLMPRRRDDDRPDLWSAYNRVQENLTQGGLQGRNATGRKHSTRPIQGIDQNVKINRALWMLAEGMKRLKA